MASSKLRSPAARHREILRPFYSLLGVLILAGAALLLSGAAGSGRSAPSWTGWRDSTCQA